MRKIFIVVDEDLHLFNLQDPSPEAYGGIAQLGERLPCKQEVRGSTPLVSTTGCTSDLESLSDSDTDSVVP